MPGPPASEAGWGDLPLVVDTSAFSRAHHPDVPGLRLFHADAVDHLRQAEP